VNDSRRKPNGYIAREQVHHAINANATITRSVAGILAGSAGNLTQTLGNVSIRLAEQREHLEQLRQIVERKEA
jgi:hypothetical protein